MAEIRKRLNWRYGLMGILCNLLAVAGLSAHENTSHAPASTTATAATKATARHDMSKMWAETLARTSGIAVSVAADEAGRLWLASMHSGHVWVSRSDDGGQHFLPGVKVNPLPEAILAEGQNRPKIAARNGVVAVSWAQALPKVFSGNIRFSRSTDDGKSFSPPSTINDNREEIGHGFGALSMSDNGRIAIVWLDGRERSAAVRNGKTYSGSAVYYALSGDGGASFAPNIKLADHSCECCRIGLTMDNDGVPVAQWRHIFGTSERDFAMARLEASAMIVRASEDHWEINACPHHGGDIAIDSNGRRHLVWFTGSQKAPGIFYRYIDGNRMSTPMSFGDLDAQAGNPAVFARDGRVVLAWREFDGKNYRLLVRHSNDSGDTWASPHEVATTSSAADLPLFVTGAKTPWLVWSSEAEGIRIFDLVQVQ